MHLKLLFFVNLHNFIHNLSIKFLMHTMPFKLYDLLLLQFNINNTKMYSMYPSISFISFTMCIWLSNYNLLQLNLKFMLEMYLKLLCCL